MRRKTRKEGDSLWTFFNCLAVIAYLSPPGSKKSKNTSPSLGGPERKASCKLSKQQGGAAAGRGTSVEGRGLRKERRGFPGKRLGELDEGHKPHLQGPWTWPSGRLNACAMKLNLTI